MSINFKKIISKVTFILVLIFVLIYIRDTDFKALFEIDVDYGLLIGVTLLILASRFIMPFAWQELIYQFDKKKIEPIDLLYIYAKSWMGRYIPGKVVWVGGKIAMSMEKGISKLTAVMASFIDSIFQVFSGFLIGLLALVKIEYIVKQDIPTIWVFLLIIISLIFITPHIFNRVIGFIYLTTKKKKFEKQYYLTWITLFKSNGIIIISKLIGALLLPVMVMAFGIEVNITEFIYLMGVFSLSGAIGMAAFFAPAGLGVTEAIQIILLTPIIPKEYIVSMAVIRRVVTILCDVLFYIICFIINRFKEKCSS